MKNKLFALLLAAAMLASILAGCTEASSIEEPIDIAALKGPTGMGMTVLMGGELKGKYNIALSNAPDEVSAKLISGEADIAAVPLNLASVLYNKTEGGIVMLAVNTLGVLYILENGTEIQSIDDLAGKTLYATGQGSSPEYMLNYLLAQYGLTDSVSIEYKSEHSELAALMASGEATLGMLPEPMVTNVLLKNESVRVALDLNDLWEQKTGIAPVQGCLVVRAEYLEANEKAVQEFLKDYEASVKYVNEHHTKAALLMEAYGVVDSAKAAEESIGKSNIAYVAGGDMREMAEAMLAVLFDADAKSVGGALPGDDFYYNGGK